MRKRDLTYIARAAACVTVGALLATGLVGCKTTDFFTEVLISSSAEDVDEDNPNRVVVNSPDALEESDSLTSLKWTDKSDRTETVENLVVWSEDPNSSLVTHHSLFDLQPLIPGIEASDGVRLVFNYEAKLDHEVDTDSDKSRDDLDSVSSGNAGKQSQESGTLVDPNSTQSNEGGDGTGYALYSGGTEESQEEGDSGKESKDTGSAEGGDNAGGSDSGEDTGEGESSDPGEEDGDTVDKYAGFGGSLSVYDPHNAKQDIPEADQIAVIGKRAAVMVQAIGGEGAICAMSHDAYYEKEANTSSTFSDVFGDECDPSVVVWESDDESIKETSVKSLVSACKGKTLILYDQDLCTGDDDPNTTFFTKQQLKELYAAGVTGFAPLSFSSEYSIVDAAYFVGEALANSKNLSEDWSSRDMASDYSESIDNIVKAVIGTNTDKANWVYGSDSVNELSTEYRGSAVKSKGAETYIHALIATDAQKGLRYTGDGGKVDSTAITLFGGYGQNSFTPLGFWMQAAGVADTLISENRLTGSADDAISSDFLTLLWGTSSNVTKKKLTGSGGAYVNWHGAVSNMTIGGIGTGSDTIGKEFGGGLGSKNMPYLVVCGSKDGKVKGEAVKKAVVKSIESAKYTPYTAYVYSEKVREAVAPYSATVTSSIGHTNFREEENPFKTGLSADDVVRVNPQGLLGSWTEGNVESVLETAWLASIYTKSPEGCNYTPNYNWGDFSAEIGDKTVKGSDHDGNSAEIVEELVKEFYSTFYRVSVDYDAVVVDQGL